jgi:hypothetical protein
MITHNHHQPNPQQTQRAAEFYRHHGFKTAPTDPARLLMKASTAARSIGIDWP